MTAPGQKSPGQWCSPCLRRGSDPVSDLVTALYVHAGGAHAKNNLHTLRFNPALEPGRRSVPLGGTDARSSAVRAASSHAAVFTNA